MTTKIAIFENKKVRKEWIADEEEWYWSVVDVCAALSQTQSIAPRNYWSDLKRKLKTEGAELHEKIVHLKMKADDGKMRETDTLCTEDVFRLIQSIPSKKAEPFKLWLAAVGNERLNEIADPELAINRAIMTYKKKGYTDEWIQRRLRSKEIHDELVSEWAKHGINQSMEFALLTDEILKTWSGKTTRQYKEFKDLKKENLRDNMSRMELLLTMLGEESAKDMTKKHEPQGFEQNKAVAREGGKVACAARKQYEAGLGSSVITSLNFKQAQQLKKPKDSAG